MRVIKMFDAHTENDFLAPRNVCI